MKSVGRATASTRAAPSTPTKPPVSQHRRFNSADARIDDLQADLSDSSSVSAGSANANASGGGGAVSAGFWNRLKTIVGSGQNNGHVRLSDPDTDSIVAHNTTTSSPALSSAAAASSRTSTSTQRAFPSFTSSATSKPAAAAGGSDVWKLSRK